MSVTFLTVKVFGGFGPDHSDKFSPPPLSLPARCLAQRSREGLTAGLAGRTNSATPRFCHRAGELRTSLCVE